MEEEKKKAIQAAVDAEIAKARAEREKQEAESEEEATKAKAEADKKKKQHLLNKEERLLKPLMMPKKHIKENLIQELMLLLKLELPWL